MGYGEVLRGLLIGDILTIISKFRQWGTVFVLLVGCEVLSIKFS